MLQSQPRHPRSQPIRAAVLFSNYGPYHVARASALMAVDSIDPHFVEIARSERKYPWEVSVANRPLQVTTLFAQPFEDLRIVDVVPAIHRTLTNINPDVVVACGYGQPAMLAAAVWTRLNGKRCVLMFESTEWDKPRVWWKERPKGWILRWFSDAVFCGGTTNRRYLERLGVPRHRIWEKYDVVDNDWFSRRGQEASSRIGEIRADLRLPNEYFLFVGRFAPEKNLAGLLRAYQAYLRNEAGRWGLVLVGDGPERENLRNIASDLGLTGLVWAGFRQAQELPAYYASASAFILPSLVEPWGLVVNEAMATGLPILASERCGCAADLVQDGRNGYTFDPTNVTQMTQTMARMASLSLANRTLMGAASQEIISHYAPHDWAASLSDCVRTVADKPSRRCDQSSREE